MHTPSIHRRLRLPLAAVLASLAGLAAATPTTGQERFAILVPPLMPMEGARDKFGRDVAKDVREMLDKLATHRAFPEKEMKDGLKRFSLKEEDLSDCVKARQFAIQLDVNLVMCGSYTESGGTNQVTAKVVVPATGVEFPMQGFAARNAEQAAEQLVAGFDQINQTLRLATFCNDALQQNAWQDAVAKCQQALDANPQSITALYGLASAYDKLEQPEQVMPFLQRILEIEPQHEDALLFAGVVASKTGQRDAASDYFHRYLELNPGNVDVRLQVATDAANAGNPEVALTIAEEAIPTSEDIRLKEYAGHFALAAAQKMEEPASPDPAAASQMYDKALGYYEEVFAAQPDSASPTMLRNMLAAYRKMERTQEALDFGQRAIAAHGDDPQLLSAYADVLNQAGRRNEALAMLERVARLDPEYTGLNARKGSWLLEDGNLSGARAAFQVAISKGEMEADAAARAIIGAGFQKFGRRNQHQAAIPYYELGRELATTAVTRAMANFFQGYALYQMADPIAKAQTKESAQRTLPMFRQVVQLMQGAEAYTDQAKNRAEILNAANRQIEIAELILRQGG